jgi:hypothetical protein
MHQQLREYKIEKKICMWVRERKGVNIAVLDCNVPSSCYCVCDEVNSTGECLYSVLG